MTKVAGYDTNTGKDVENWECAVSWLPMLLIENAGQQRQTGAAVESFRNEVVKANENANALSSRPTLATLVAEQKTATKRLKGQ